MVGVTNCPNIVLYFLSACYIYFCLPRIICETSWNFIHFFLIKKKKKKSIFSTFDILWTINNHLTSCFYMFVGFMEYDLFLFSLNSGSSDWSSVCTIKISYFFEIILNLVSIIMSSWSWFLQKSWCLLDFFSFLKEIAKAI